MQRDTRRRDDDLFDFRDSLAGFGSFGRSGSLMSSFFRGRDPFDDPFFAHPFGSSMFHSRGSPIGEASQFLEQRRPMQRNRSQGVLIQEISPDVNNEGENASKGEQSNSSAGKGPHVQDPDEESGENKGDHMQYRKEYRRPSEQQARLYSFQSSAVTYGGLNGAYYTSSTTRRTGGDGNCERPLLNLEK